MFAVIKKFGILLEKDEKKKIPALFVIMLIGAFLEIAGVSLMVPVLTVLIDPDILSSGTVTGKLAAAIGITSHASFVLLCFGILIALFLVKNLYLMFQTRVTAQFVYETRYRMQKKVLAAYLYKPYEFFLNVSSAEILRVVSSDVEQTYRLFMTLLSLVTDSIVSLLLIVLVFFLDPLITGITAAVLLLISVVIVLFVKPVLNRKGQDYRTGYRLANKWLLQSVHGIKEIKVFGREERFLAEYASAGKKRIDAEKRYRVIGRIPRAAIEAGCVCSALAAVAFAVSRGRSPADLLPTLGAFAMAAVRLMPAANRIIGVVGDAAFYGPSLDNLIRVLNPEQDAPAAVLPAENEAKETLTFSRAVSFRNITYRYPGSTEYVLENASMEIPIGASVGIVGRSGAGKTTAVDLLLGLLSPEGGEVLCDGVNVKNAYRAWLSHIGYIPQTIFMMDDTVRANVAFGGTADDERIWQALRDAQLEEFVKELPDGLDTQIGERGIRLSGGQRQRIGIARALYTDPDLLFFDEATSSLDSETETAIIDSVDHLRGKKTMVIIAHRLQTIAGCSLVYRVEDGCIKKDETLSAQDAP